jgi:hypothetical protein
MTFREIYNGMLVFRLVLDISGGKEHGDVVMWSDNGGDNQKWNFDEDMTIRSELGSVLQVKDSSTDNCASIVAAGNEGNESQKFRVVPVQE